MRVLVTGGAGFVGSHLVDRLLAEGHELDVVDDLSTGSLVNLAEARADRTGRLRIHTLDVRAAEFVPLLARREPEVVVHLAPLGGPSVLAATVATTAVRKLVTVDTALAPALVRARAEDHLEYTVLELAEVHGPRAAAGVVADLVAGRPVAGPADRPIDLLAIDDAVDALVRALTRGGGMSFVIASGRPVPLVEVARLLGVTPVLDPPGHPAPPAVTADRAARRRARTYLGWTPFTALPEAVAATAAWWADHQPG